VRPSTCTSIAAKSWCWNGGGIGSIATTDESDIARAEPYLKEAMLAVAAGNPAPHPVTKPYGCSIKY
jgi:hypothetical protein